MDAYLQHGHGALKAALKRASDAGGDWTAQLGPVGAELRSWRTDMVEALGGEGAVSPQQQALVELATRTHLMIESVDRFILGMPSLVNGRQRKLYAVVEQRQRLADSLAKMLGQLGLERRRKPAASITELLRRATAASAPAASAKVHVASQDAHQVETGAQSGGPAPAAPEGGEAA